MVLAILAPEARCDYSLATWQESLITTVCTCTIRLPLSMKIYKLPRIQLTCSGGVWWNDDWCRLVGEIHGQIRKKKSRSRPTSFQTSFSVIVICAGSLRFLCVRCFDVTSECFCTKLSYSSCIPRTCRFWCCWRSPSVSSQSSDHNVGCIEKRSDFVQGDLLC